jgi:hypothetical protein
MFGVNMILLKKGLAVPRFSGLNGILVVVGSKT